MRWAEGFIAVDWGTTNRRAYLLDSSGHCSNEFEDSKGLLSVSTSEFPAAVAEIRGKLGDRPMLLAGMVGSNRGWKEAPYVPCPAGIDDLVANLVWADKREAIVPGVSYIADGRGDSVRIAAIDVDLLERQPALIEQAQNAVGKRDRANRVV